MKSLAWLNNRFALVVALCLTGSVAYGGLIHHLPFQNADGNSSLVNLGTGSGAASQVANNEGVYTNDVPPYSGGTWAWYTKAHSPTREAALTLNNSQPDLTADGDQISILAWIKIDPSADETLVRGLVCKRPNGGSGWALLTLGNEETEDGNSIRFTARTQTAQRTVDSAYVIPRGVWTHVAVTWTAGQGVAGLKMYVNAESVTVSGAFPVNEMPTANASNLGVLVGASGTNWTLPHFIGTIDELRIYDEVLTQAQIKEIMKPPQGTVFMIR